MVWGYLRIFKKMHSISERSLHIVYYISIPYFLMNLKDMKLRTTECEE
jgi:hypothetical protein